MDGALLDNALRTAQRQFGLNWAAPKAAAGASATADATMRLSLGQWSERFDVQLRRNLRPQTVNLLLAEVAASKRSTLLVADHVTPPMAETLRQHGIAFIDAAGNAYIDRPPVFVYVTGRRPDFSIVKALRQGRAFAPSGLKVILALLCRPAAVSSNYRQIGVLAGVAHGTAGWVIPELQDQDLIDVQGSQRRLINVDRLFDRWAEAYIRRLRPKLQLGRFNCDQPEWWKTAPIDRHGLALGGEPAAAEKLEGFLRPGAVTLYTVRLDSRAKVELGLREDERGRIEILRRFWSFSPSSRTVPEPVIYADLLATEDARNLEAARLIREQFLAGLE